jgi:hypothetical protein
MFNLFKIFKKKPQKERFELSLIILEIIVLPVKLFLKNENIKLSKKFLNNYYFFFFLSDIISVSSTAFTASVDLASSRSLTVSRDFFGNWMEPENSISKPNKDENRR